MNKIIHYALAAMLAAVLPAAQADKPKTAAKSAKKEKAAGFVKQVREADLYGAWFMMVKDEKMFVLNHTTIRPDRTARDFMCIVNFETGETTYLSQDIAWTFDAAAQTVTEKVTDFRVRQNGEAQTDASKIGETQTAKVRMKKVAGKPLLLEWQKAGSESMAYLKESDKISANIQEMKDACSKGF